MLGTVRRSWTPLWFLIAGLLAALIGIATTAPLRGSASAEPTVFRPDRFVAVTVTVPAEHSAFPGLTGLREGSFSSDMFGTFGSKVTPKDVALDSVAAAARELNRPVRVPSTLPAGLSGGPKVTMFTAGSGSYTLDLPKIHAFLRDAGFSDLQLPPTIHGATIVASVPAGVALQWGDKRDGLAFIQVRQPTITVPGQVDAAGLRELLLSYPRAIQLTPDSIRQLRAIEDWTRTVPIPVTTRQHTESVPADGSTALFVRDPRHDRSVLLWQRGGTVHVLTGPFSRDQLVATANSLQ